MPSGYLYAIRMCIPNYEECPIKIGFSANPERRLTSYSSEPYPIEILGVWPAPSGTDDEAAFHRHFKADRLSGEWFRPSAGLTELIEAQVKAYKEAITAAEDEMRPIAEEMGASERKWREASKVAAYTKFKPHFETKKPEKTPEEQVARWNRDTIYAPVVI